MRNAYCAERVCAQLQESDRHASIPSSLQFLNCDWRVVDGFQGVVDDRWLTHIVRRAIYTNGNIADQQTIAGSKRGNEPGPCGRIIKPLGKIARN